MQIRISKSYYSLWKGFQTSFLSQFYSFVQWPSKELERVRTIWITQAYFYSFYLVHYFSFDILEYPYLDTLIHKELLPNTPLDLWVFSWYQSKFSILCTQIFIYPSKTWYSQLISLLILPLEKGAVEPSLELKLIASLK